MLLIAAIHILRLGSYLSGQMYVYYYSYMSDMLLPFGSYFLLGMNDPSFPFLRNHFVKAIIIFGFATTAEILQGFGYYALGQTFDWMDIVMYAVGVSLAVFIDKLVLEKHVRNWKVY